MTRKYIYVTRIYVARLVIILPRAETELVSAPAGDGSISLSTTRGHVSIPVCIYTVLDRAMEALLYCCTSTCTAATAVAAEQDLEMSCLGDGE